MAGGASKQATGGLWLGSRGMRLRVPAPAPALRARRGSATTTPAGGLRPSLCTRLSTDSAAGERPHSHLAAGPRKLSSMTSQASASHASPV